jgi:hypothetical protein
VIVPVEPARTMVSLADAVGVGVELELGSASTFHLEYRSVMLHAVASTASGLLPRWV